MSEETGRDPEEPGEPPEREQETWSSPVRGIALGLALSLVLWVVIALAVRLLCEWWLASRLFRGVLDAALTGEFGDTFTVRLTLPPPLSPRDLRGAPDDRRLGLAIATG